MREILFRGKRVDNGEWVDLIGFEGFYQITINGDIRSVDRYVNHWRGGKCFKKGTILKQTINYKGYTMVRLVINGKGGLKSVHRLVAKNFIPNPENKEQVNHIDGNKQNNHVDNLEWNTQYENMAHAFKTGLNKGSMLGVKGENHPRNILSDIEKEDIINRKNNGESMTDLSILFNVSYRTIQRICK